MTITAIDSSAFKYEDKDGPRLAFPTHIGSRRFIGTDTVALKKIDGVVVDGKGRVSAWPIENFVEHEGDVLAVGPWIDGTSAFDTQKPSATTIARLLPAIRAIGSEGDFLGGIFTPAIRWLDDGGVLIFPPKLASWVRDNQTTRENHDSWERWNHPDNRGKAGWAFSLGMMAWQALHNSDPFGGEEGESRRERIRLGFAIPIENVRPEVRKDISTIIHRTLCAPPEQVPDLNEWDAILLDWQQNGPTENLSPEKLNERQQKAVRDTQKLENRLKTRRWIRKSGWKFLVILTAVIMTGAFISAPIKKALEKPQTMGMTPLEVAAAYYAAIDSLDAEMMEDCLARHAGKSDLRQVNMIFVTHRVRQGYERIGDFPKPSEWLAAGKPPLDNGLWPWGITNLELKERNNQTIEADYYFWTQPEMENEAEPPTSPAIIKRHDVLRYTEGRRSWEISEITREERLLRTDDPDYGKLME